VCATHPGTSRCGSARHLLTGCSHSITVELAVEAELGGVAEAQLLPSLVQIALAMARILDSSRAPTPKPAAAKVLVSVMDTLHKGSARGHRGRLAVVRAMATGDQ
jgi:hypothetical protein